MLHFHETAEKMPLTLAEISILNEHIKNRVICSWSLKQTEFYISNVLCIQDFFFFIANIFLIFLSNKRCKECRYKWTQRDCLWAWQHTRLQRGWLQLHAYHCWRSYQNSVLTSRGAGKGNQRWTETKFNVTHDELTATNQIPAVLGWLLALDSCYIFFCLQWRTLSDNFLAIFYSCLDISDLLLSVFSRGKYFTVFGSTKKIHCAITINCAVTISKWRVRKSFCNTEGMNFWEWISLTAAYGIVMFMLCFPSPNLMVLLSHK